MKILVPVKRVVDYNIKVQVKTDNSNVDIDNVKMSMNPFDEISVEEAVKLKEQSIASEVVVVSIGPAKSEDVLRTAIAMGADRGILVEEDDVEPLDVAKILAKICQEENPELIILGKQAIDDDSNQTGQMLAALLDYPQATFASNLEVKKDIAKVIREIDGGLETIEVKLPAIITTDLRLNEPRYPSLPNIMKARAKEVKKVKAQDYDIKLSPRLELIKVEEPPVRKGGVKLESVSELVEKLKEKGVL